jgi:uncharacterized coiled-coil protein SlyX
MSLAFAVMVKERLVALEERIASLERQLATVEEKTNGLGTAEVKHRATRKARARIPDGGTEPSTG